MQNMLDERYAYWEDVVRRQQRSELDVDTWCKQEGIKLVQFETWKKRISRKGTYFVCPLSILDQWSSIIAISKMSYLSENDWCTQNDIPIGDFHVWKSKIEKENSISISLNEATRAWEIIIEKCHEDAITKDYWCSKHVVDPTCFSFWEKRLQTEGDELNMSDKTASEFSDEQWMNIIKDCRSTTLGAEEWCKRNRIPIDDYLEKLKAFKESHKIARRGHSHFSDIDWVNIIEAARKSKLTQRDWCNRNDISERAFYIKLRQLAASGIIEPGRKSKKFLIGLSNDDAIEENTCNSDEDWVHVIKECRKSKLGAEEWCSLNDIDIDTYIAKVKELYAKGDIGYRSYADFTDDDWIRLIKKKRSSLYSVKGWCYRNDIAHCVYSINVQRLVKLGKIEYQCTKVDEKVQECENSSISGESTCDSPETSDWIPLISELHNSKLSATEWCEMHNIDLDEFNKNYEAVKGAGIPLHREYVNFSEDDWYHIILEQRASGKGRGEWCKINHISGTYFGKWQRKFIAENKLPRVYSVKTDDSAKNTTADIYNVHTNPADSEYLVVKPEPLKLNPAMPQEAILTISKGDAVINVMSNTPIEIINLLLNSI